MINDRVATIEQLLVAAFSPTELLVKDQGHLHAGHTGAQEGTGHFEVKIVSDRFAGQSRIARHQMIYEALGAFIDSDIHALSIKAVSPSDR